MKIILTHTDFDGVVSGSLLSIATNVKFIKFLSHKQIWREQLTGEEIIADLPCPWKCGLWFDHHESNLKEMEYRNIDIEKIPGKFQMSDSCANIIYNFYKNKTTFPDYFPDVIEETNQIDSMKYDTIDEWLKKTPTKMLASTTQLLNDEDYKTFLHYLINLAKQLKIHSPDELIEHNFVKKRYTLFEEYKEKSQELIEKTYYFDKQDQSKTIALLDFSEFKTAPRIDKNLIYIFQPDTDAVLLINSEFKNNVKTNNLKFSFGVNFTKSEQLSHINVAQMFEELDIGGGHPKAAGGNISCSSKAEKIKIKEEIIQDIIKKWHQQAHSLKT